VPDVVVVGAGIAGLTVAYRLLRDARDRVAVTVLEAGERPGGPICSARIAGYLCEHGPQGLLDNAPGTLALLDELGLEPVTSFPSSRRRYVFRAGRLREVPASALSAITTDVLSWKGKLRLLAEPLIPAKIQEDESIDAFAALRLGREAARALVDPMVSGIYAGDAARLSIRAAFPRLWQLEREHGSLVRGMLARRRQRSSSNSDVVRPRMGQLVSFVDGVEALPKALAAALGARVKNHCRVTALQRVAGSSNVDGRWRVSLDGRELEADHVVIAGHPAMASSLLAPLDRAIGALLGEIPSAPVAVVALGYARGDVARPLDGFGFLVPRSEGLHTLGVLWESSIFPHRAPPDRVLLRAIIGGVHDPDVIALDDDQLLAIAGGDLRQTLGISAPPAFMHIVRHRLGIPQCTMGHPARMERLEEALKRWPGLHLTGWGYRGVSVNHCIADAALVAGRIVGSGAVNPGTHSSSSTPNLQLPTPKERFPRR
jgi:protoporphyrinogen/coproporphyrinogen III oxidase